MKPKLSIFSNQTSVVVYSFLGECGVRCCRGSQLTWDLVDQGVLGLVDLVDLVGVLGLVGQAGVQAWVDLASLGLADLASLGLMGFLVDVQMVYAALYLHGE